MVIIDNNDLFICMLWLYTDSEKLHELKSSFETPCLFRSYLMQQVCMYSKLCYRFLGAMLIPSVFHQTVMAP